MMSEQPHNYTLSLAGMGKIGLTVDPADDPLGTGGSKSNSERATHSDNTPSPMIKQQSKVMQSQMMSDGVTPEFALEGLKQGAVVMVENGEEKMDLV